MEPGEDPTEASADDADDGDDVASRNPDEIAQEIEQTRAELADTIDAIAERINPKRAAARGAQAVKAQVSSARDKVAGNGAAPVSDDPAVAAYEPSGSQVPAVPIAAVAAIVVAILLFLRRRHAR
jgi:hypothetical protein